ncbi:NADP-dependent oxidoreductase [Cytophagales bacterium RKSG123]|nr:NADP-dependent oxidoreductase [Xanthovirga aplysinae]
MKAAALKHFGGLNTLKVLSLPVPKVAPDEVLIHVESAGVGQWDPMEREGEFAKMTGSKPNFPYILGSDGAGTIAAVGNQVTNFKKGDRVYCASFMNPKGGFYAEYIAVKANLVAHTPDYLSTDEAGAMPIDAITTLCGLEDVLKLKGNETLMIFGASGGIGHMAIQFAKHIGARVLAIASGTDGVSLAKRLGADVAIDGRKDNVVKAARDFAPNGIDTAFVTAGGKVTDEALTAMRKGGRVAYPNGVHPAPKVSEHVSINNFDAVLNEKTTKRLHQLLEAGHFKVHIGEAFDLEHVTDAHLATTKHHLGKLTLHPR